MLEYRVATLEVQSVLTRYVGIQSCLKLEYRVRALLGYRFGMQLGYRVRCSIDVQS